MRENWKYQPLGEICDFVGGSQPPKNEWIKTCLNGYVRMLQIRDFTKSRDSEIEYVKLSKKLRLCKEDDILLGRYGASVGKVLTGLEGAYNVAIIKSMPNSNYVSKSYIKRYFESSLFQSNLLRICNSRTAQAGFSKEDIYSFIVPVPPLSEQERIVSYLDAEFAKIDALKANIEQQLQASKDLFQSALKEMLTPQEGWEEKKIGDICEVTDFVANGSFATLRENVKYHNEPNYAVLVRLADYSSNFDKSKFVYVDKHSYDFLSKSRLNGGEIIMSNVGSIGKCFICPDLGMPMTIGPNSLLVKTPYSQFFIYYFKNITFQEKLKTITNQTTLSKFNKTQFRELTILIPSLPEQERIAARLDTISEKVKALQANYDQTINLCNDLKQSLLKSIFE